MAPRHQTIEVGHAVVAVAAIFRVQNGMGDLEPRHVLRRSRDSARSSPSRSCRRASWNETGGVWKQIPLT